MVMIQFVIIIKYLQYNVYLFVIVFIIQFIIERRVRKVHLNFCSGVQIQMIINDQLIVPSSYNQLLSVGGYTIDM